MRKTRLLLTALVLGLVVFPVVPDEGRIPIFAPTTIVAPGRYFLSTSIATMVGSIITIGVDDVDIDLNGFVLSSTATAPVISATGVEGVTIRNGRITGGTAGTSIVGGTRVVLEDLDVSDASGVGVVLDETTQFAIRRVVVRSTGGFGVEVGDAAPGIPVRGTIEDSLIEDTGGGLSISGPSYADGPTVAILNNRISGVSGTGLFYSFGRGCLIARNTIDRPAIYGMFVGLRASKLHNNVITGAGAFAFGISLSGDHNLILDNVVSANAGRGVVMSSATGNHIEGNVTNSNGGFGLNIYSAGNVYRRNTARGNAGVAGDPPLCAAPCSPDLCVVAGNTSHGDNYLPGPPTFPGCI